MAKIKVRLLRPLVGHEEGDEVEYEKADADRLIGYGTAELVETMKSDAPPRKSTAAAKSKSAKD